MSVSVSTQSNPSETDSSDATVDEIDSAPVADNPYLSRKTLDADGALEKLEKQIRMLEDRVDEILANEQASTFATDSDSHSDSRVGDVPQKPETVWIWGVPYSQLSLPTALRHIDRLIASREPGYFITANLNWNMLTSQHEDLAKVNDAASFIVCDGMPMIWWSRLWTKTPLAERIPGSELIYALNKWAAVKGHRVFFLGGAPGIAQTAADKLCERYPDLQVVGVESPPFRPLTDQEQQELIDRIRATKPDIVYLAFGQPKGERWMFYNFRKLGAPLCVQIGASFDFVAGGVVRAPVWVQKSGMEWAYRLMQEPKRLAGRYWKNGCFLLQAVLNDCWARIRGT